MPAYPYIFLTFILIFSASACKDTEHLPKAVLEDGTEVSLRLAKTPEEQRLGLSHVKELPENEGMLFIYKSRRKLSFWMKDCYIPLDLIWLSENGTVFHIVHNAKPWPPGTDPSKLESYSAYGNYVLELAGGVAKKKGIKIGSKIKLSL
jgi:uncharacterized membrane protein (UPF0127 family)